jgi:hypothetical protein
MLTNNKCPMQQIRPVRDHFGGGGLKLWSIARKVNGYAIVSNSLFGVPMDVHCCHIDG